MGPLDQWPLQWAGGWAGRLDPQHGSGKQGSKCFLGTSRDLEAEGEGRQEGSDGGWRGTSWEMETETWRSRVAQRSQEGPGSDMQLEEGAGERARCPKLRGSWSACLPPRLGFL